MRLRCGRRRRLAGFFDGIGGLFVLVGGSVVLFAFFRGSVILWVF
jgi:hypothetical protein